MPSEVEDVSEETLELVADLHIQSMKQAVFILKQLLDKITAEEWAHPMGKRFVLTGIKMCINRLSREIT